MATTLTAIATAMETAIEAVSIADGSNWGRVEGRETPDQLNSGDHDKRFFIEYGDDAGADEFSIGVNETRRLSVVVLCYREVLGDAHAELIEYRDDFRRVQVALETYASFDSSVVVFSQPTKLERTKGWVTGRLPFTIQYQSTYSAS